MRIGDCGMRIEGIAEIRNAEEMRIAELSFACATDLVLGLVSGSFANSAIRNSHSAFP